MKIIVTGGAGFVGSHTVEYFANKGNDVIALDNLSRPGVRFNWEYLKQYRNVELRKGDIRNPKTLEKLATDVGVIIHTAAQVAVTTSLINPRDDFEINAIGTFNVLEAARVRDAAVIYCSTNKVYGANVNKIPIVEKDKRYEFADGRYRNGIPESFPVDLCEHTPYGCSKLAGDIYAQDYGHVYGLKTGVFRMSCIYGERQFGVEDQGWVAWFTIATWLNKPITIYGDGKQVRDVLYVKDLIRAYDLFIESNSKQAVFNIGGGNENPLSLLELIETLEDLTGKRTDISYADWRSSDQKVYISDITKAKKELGWEPRIGLDKGISNLIAWVIENQMIFNR